MVSEQVLVRTIELFANLAAMDLFIKIVDDAGTVLALADVDDSAPSDDGLVWLANITLPVIKFSCVVCSVALGEIGYTRFEIIPKPFPTCNNNRLILAVPSFGEAPLMTLSVCCFPLVRIALAVSSICVGTCDKFGGVAVQSLALAEKFILELRLMDGITMIAKASLTGTLSLVGKWLMAEFSDRLMIADRYDLSGNKKKIEIVLTKVTDQDLHEVRVLDVFPLHKVPLDLIQPVGKLEGTLTVTLGDIFIEPLGRMPDILRMKYPVYLMRRVTAQLSIAGSLGLLIGGTITSGVVGFGVEKICVIAEKHVLKLESSSSFRIDFDTFSCEDLPPVLGLILRDQDGKLISLNTIPLVDNACYHFDNSQISDIGVKLKSIDNMNPITAPKLYPYSSLNPSREPAPAQGGRVQLKIVVRSIRHNTIPLQSSFVAVRMVSCSLCPILLTMDEIIDLQKDIDDFGSACTPTRENTIAPIFESELELETVYDSNDWIYFVLFDNKGLENTTQAIGHACIPITHATNGSEFTLPIIDANSCCPLSSSLLNISFPSNPIPWRPIVIQQLSAAAYAGEISLHVNVFRGRQSTTHTPLAVISNHVWLPIKSIHPLYIRDCPPIGYMQFELRDLSGEILNKCTFSFTDRENEVTCGRVRFSFSRYTN